MTLIAEKENSFQTSSKNGEAKLVSLANKTNGFNFLKKTNLRKITNWSFSYLNQNRVVFSDKFPQVKIGTFLTRCKNPIKIQDDETYKQVTIKLYGKGAKIRDESFLTGKEIKTKTQFLVNEGQFLFSRIDARNGAFAIATKEIDGAIVTNDFPVYDIDSKIINSNYFSLLISTKRFSQYFQGLSSGTTNRQRMNEADFLEYQIPLPPIDSEDISEITQKKLVADYNAKISQAEANEQKAESLEKDIETYLLKELGIEIQEKEQKSWKGFSFLQPTKLKELGRWSVDFLNNQDALDEIKKCKFDVVRFENLITFAQYGISEKSTETKKGIPMLRMNNIFKGELDLQKLKYVDIPVEKNQSLILQKEDFLFNRTNSKELVGKTAIFDVEGQFIFASYLIRLRVNKEKANIYFINYLFNSSVVRKQIDIISRQVLGQANVNLTELKSFLIPLPSMKIQTKIVKHINAKKAEIKELKDNAEDLRKQAKIEFEAELFEV